MCKYVKLPEKIIKHTLKQSSTTLKSIEYEFKPKSRGIKNNAHLKLLQHQKPGFIADNSPALTLADVKLCILINIFTQNGGLWSLTMI